MSCKAGLLALGLGFLFGSIGLRAESLPQAGSASEAAISAQAAGQGDPEVLWCLKGATMLLIASPQIVPFGASGNLSWSVEFPDDNCTSLSLKLNDQRVATSGNLIIQPSHNTTFNLVLNAGPRGGFAERTVSRNVLVSYPETVIINENTPDPIGTMLGALSPWNANVEQTVELCNVDLDMTGLSGIEIGGVGQKRALIASPGCARGPRSLGPRIFVTDKRQGGTPLFIVRESNVRISGFRLQGPMPDIEWDDSHQEIGIDVVPFVSPAPLSNVEISNMEISNWSGAGIKVNDNGDGDAVQGGRLTNQNLGGVHVVNNYLHHNRHIGEGYGVVVSAGAYALIEQNVFEENRHAIAGTSNGSPEDFPGYTARDNLILPGGGLACATKDVFGAQIILGCWQTHQIDMHGDASTTFGGEWCCGNAGETMIIQRNTILYTGGDTPYALELGGVNGPVPVWTSGYAIKIRGNPKDKAVVDGNVFKHANLGDAISQNGDADGNTTNPIQVFANNIFGVDPTEENLPFCDFAGDGQLDQFMATGVTWWAKSPVTHQWRYMNRMFEHLSELQFGDFDHDGVCDVAVRSTSPFRLPAKYSKSGMGPWVSLIANAQ